MKTVILLDGWVFRGNVLINGNEIIIENAQPKERGNSVAFLHEGSRVTTSLAAVVAIIEGDGPTLPKVAQRGVAGT